MSCSIATLAAGASATFTLVFKVGAAVANGSTITNIATVSSASFDSTPGNDSASTSTSVTTSADVAVTKSGTTSVVAGGDITYSVAVANNGPGDAQSVTLTDVLPAGTTFVSEAQNGGPAFTCTTPASGATGTVTCSIATLPSGASATFTLVFKVGAAVASGSTITNSATVSSTTSDPTPGNNSASASTSVADGTSPTVTINQVGGQADPTSTSPILFTVAFSEPVTGFAGTDVSFAGSTAAGTLVAAVSGNGATYTVSVSGMTGSGTVVASIPAAAAIDLAGNASLASTSIDNSVIYTADPPRFVNLSARMQVLTGNDVMIGGFVIGGSSNKTLAIVATGPSLSAFGITNPLANPTLTLFRSSDQQVLATNDNWQAAANAAQLTAAGFAPTDPAEAAILIDLPPGAYTAIVQGASNTTGVAVVGVYEVDGTTIPLINISTRGRVLTGNDVMIGGFVIQGAGAQAVAIVATGPSLAAFGIASPLANPTLTLVRSSDQSVIATNDDWQTHANASQLQAAGLAPTNPLESGLYVTLQPGAYTVILSGVGGGTGVGVVGVYRVN